MGIGLLVSCDSSISTNRPLAENTAPGDSATVAHAPMPTGTSLPAPGAGPRGTLRSYRAAGARNSKSGAAASPYGCYLASRPYSEEVRFRSVYLYFPDEMVEAAGEETRPLIFRLGAVRKGRTDTTGVRYANCVIPDADGAEATARRQVIRKGEEQAVTEAVQSAGRAAGAKSDCTDIVKVVEYCDYGGCSVVSVEVTVACGGGGDGGSDGGGDGGGGGGSGGATDPYPDENRAGGGGGEDDSGGGTGEECTAIDPEPGSECEPEDPEPVNEQELCPSDPLEDMDIRATCDGIEGGRFGENARGDGKPHHGIDLLAEVGTEVYAMEEGVVWSRNKSQDFGRYLIVQTNDGEFVMYAHLSQRAVEGGESLSQGEYIGETGVSGNACRDSCGCGPSHLHLGVKEGESWAGGSPKDPEGYIGTQFDSEGDATSDTCPN